MDQESLARLVVVTVPQQLRRFIYTRSGRKIRYGRVLAGALDLARVPHPTDLVLAQV